MGWHENAMYAKMMLNDLRELEKSEDNSQEIEMKLKKLKKELEDIKGDENIE